MEFQEILNNTDLGDIGAIGLLLIALLRGWLVTKEAKEREVELVHKAYAEQDLHHEQEKELIKTISLEAAKMAGTAAGKAMAQEMKTMMMSEFAQMIDNKLDQYEQKRGSNRL